jgi:hypothetical protein
MATGKLPDPGVVAAWSFAGQTAAVIKTATANVRVSEVDERLISMVWHRLIWESGSIQPYAFSTEMAKASVD